MLMVNFYSFIKKWNSVASQDRHISLFLKAGASEHAAKKEFASVTCRWRNHLRHWSEEFQKAQSEEVGHGNEMTRISFGHLPCESTQLWVRERDPTIMKEVDVINLPPHSWKSQKARYGHNV
jgi:hypothetical protein